MYICFTLLAGASANSRMVTTAAAKLGTGHLLAVVGLLALHQLWSETRGHIWSLSMCSVLRVSACVLVPFYEGRRADPAAIEATGWHANFSVFIGISDLLNPSWESETGFGFSHLPINPLTFGSRHMPWGIRLLKRPAGKIYNCHSLLRCLFGWIRSVVGIIAWLVLCHHVGTCWSKQNKW